MTPGKNDTASSAAAGAPTESLALCRAHGLQWPLHPLQVLAWIVILIVGALYFGVTVPGLLPHWQPAGYLILGLCLALHIVCLLVASCINPADDNALRKSRPASATPFDRNLHKHVIENLYCNICLTGVGKKTKHCGSCNKCVSEFDHHCKWLNSCVGGKNYRWFAACLVTGLISCTIVTVLCVLQFVAYFTDSNTGSILQQYSPHVNSNGTMSSAVDADFQIMHASVQREAWLAVTALEGAIAFIALLLLGHLIVFHIYLRCKGLSTYDYVVMDRSQDSAAEKRPISANVATSTKQKCWHKKAVAPSDNPDIEAVR